MLLEQLEQLEQLYIYNKIKIENMVFRQKTG